ncbi:MAG: hypothetical protein VW438_03360 [Euryarchaeota archaeon]
MKFSSKEISNIVLLLKHEHNQAIEILEKDDSFEILQGSGDGHRVLGVIYKDGFSAPEPVVEQVVEEVAEEAPAKEEVKEEPKKAEPVVEEKAAEVIEEPKAE